MESTCTTNIVIFLWYLDHVYSDFFIGTALLSWDDAQSDCSRRGMQLACLKNETLFQTAKTYIENTTISLNTDVWIGLRTTSTSSPYIYYWMDGENATYLNWRIDEPNFQNIDQCIRLYQDSFHFGTSHCNLTKFYLCQDTSIYGEWLMWSECSVSCGNGTQYRNRSCDTLYPNTGRGGCMGSTFEVQNCNLGYCPVHGLWSAWREWSDCGWVQCGIPNRTRSRSCDSPPPMYGGDDCQGDDQETENCENLLCSSTERLVCTKNTDNNITSSSLREKMQEISRSLKVNKTNLSSEVRKKTCAEDSRPSSKCMGVMAGLVIGLYFGLFILADCTSLLR